MSYILPSNWCFLNFLSYWLNLDRKKINRIPDFFYSFPISSAYYLFLFILSFFFFFVNF